MIVAIRADASIQIGSGHIFRCLCIADQLKSQGHECFFICRNHDGNLVEVVQQKGYQVYKLENNQNIIEEKLTKGYEEWLGVSQDYDAEQSESIIKANYNVVEWLIVDHYSLSLEWESKLRNSVKNVLVIDDLANREHAADIILDCGLVNVEHDYNLLNKIDAKILIGPKYALLRPEFNRLRTSSKNKPNQLESKLKLLINLGGVDKDNLTAQILDVLESTVLAFDVEVTVVMGFSAPWKNSIIEKAKKIPYPTQVLVNVSNMAELMRDHDLAIGAAGSTAWERCCLGLPTIMICMADNQKMIAQGLQDLGVAISLDQAEISIKLKRVLQAITSSKLSDMREKSYQITNGLGVNLLMNEILQKSDI